MPSPQADVFREYRNNTASIDYTAQGVSLEERKRARAARSALERQRTETGISGLWTRVASPERRIQNRRPQPDNPLLRVGRPDPTGRRKAPSDAFGYDPVLHSYPEGITAVTDAMEREIRERTMPTYARAEMLPHENTVFGKGQAGLSGAHDDAGQKEWLSRGETYVHPQNPFNVVVQRYRSPRTESAFGAAREEEMAAHHSRAVGRQLQRESPYNPLVTGWSFKGRGTLPAPPSMRSEDAVAADLFGTGCGRARHPDAVNVTNDAKALVEGYYAGKLEVESDCLRRARALKAEHEADRLSELMNDYATGQYLPAPSPVKTEWEVAARSSQQVAASLYEDGGPPPPSHTGGRGHHHSGASGAMGGLMDPRPSPLSRPIEADRFRHDLAPVRRTLAVGGEMARRGSRASAPPSPHGYGAGYGYGEAGY